MKRPGLLVVLTLGLGLLGAGCHPGGARTAEAPAETHVITRGPLIVRAQYEGELASRLATPMASHLNSAAVIMDLAAEGQAVATGDMLVSFDASALEQELNTLERDATLARARLEALREAEHPLELDALSLQRDEAAAQLEQAQQLLADTRELRAEDLVAEQELEQQSRAVARHTRLLEAIDRETVLTRERLHPSALARAEAEHRAAERALATMREQITHATVTAATNGIVVYLPIHVGSEYRTVRVGDTVYRNQPFLLVADMTDLIVTTYIPESEMAHARPGLQADVMPLSHPDLRLPATVTSIGTLAHSIAGRPAWQKFVRMTLRLDATGEQLRSGMTVRVELTTYAREDVLLLPRRAARWSGDTTACRVAGPGGPREVAVTLGPADDRHFEIITGLEPGDRVILP